MSRRLGQRGTLVAALTTLVAVGLAGAWLWHAVQVGHELGVAVGAPPQIGRPATAPTEQPHEELTTSERQALDALLKQKGLGAQR